MSAEDSFAVVASSPEGDNLMQAIMEFRRAHGNHHTNTIIASISMMSMVAGMFQKAPLSNLQEKLDERIRMRRQK